MSSRKARRAGAVAGAVAALVPMVWLRGFTVDDALITARVSAHIAAGFGHRFNRGGPVVDAVTPLGFEYFLAPFSHGDPLRAFYFAKWFGGAVWLVAAAWLGSEVARMDGSRRRFGVFAVFALCLPLAAWAVAGMETGLVIGLATLAISGSSWAPLAGGVAAALRPELVPWAVVLAAARTIPRRNPASIARSLALAMAPAGIVALVRVLAFGHAVPLAFYAKPSDFEHGLRYVAAAAIWTGVPVLLVAPRRLWALRANERAIVAAAVAHAFALILAGGDWMAFFRLFMPVLPGLLLVAARVLATSGALLGLLRLSVACGLSAILFFQKGRAARGIGAQRLELIERARPILREAKAVAALDVGWVGVATDADVVDLAGVTDEVIAHLPGGHTSKRVPSALLENRGVDALVLLVSGPLPLDWSRARFVRTVEARIAWEAADLGFVIHGMLELGGTSETYLVLGLQNRP